MNETKRIDDGDGRLVCWNWGNSPVGPPVTIEDMMDKVVGVVMAKYRSNICFYMVHANSKSKLAVPIFFKALVISA